MVQGGPARGQLTTPFYAAVALACVATLAVAAALWWLLTAPMSTKVTAYFTSAVGLFAGSDVRVLGVKVGEIESVTPLGSQVRVELEVDRGVPVPADAGAVSVAPSLVSDRYVQLTPPYTHGERMGSGAVIPPDRTASPLELDELYASLDRLTTALGPDGANADGALSDFLDVGAQTFDGAGQRFNDTVRSLSEAASALSQSRGDLFGTVDNLRTFTSMLADNDRQVRLFNDQLAAVSEFLAAEREDLGLALEQLTIALAEVAKFIADHRAALATNLDKLTQLTQLLVDQKADLQEFLDVAPIALSNLANAYNGYAGGLETRSNLNELADPSLLLCRALTRPDATTSGLLQTLPPQFVQACQYLVAQLGDGLGIPSPADVVASLQSGQLPPIPILTAAEAGP